MADEMSVERARALLEAATPGPWRHFDPFPEYRRKSSGHRQHMVSERQRGGNALATSMRGPDAALAAAAPDLARAYLAEHARAERAAAVVAAAREVAAEYVGPLGDDAQHGEWPAMDRLIEALGVGR